MSVPVTVADALAGARYAPSQHAGKTALIAGAAHKLGEQVLNRLLSNPAYRRVYVLASNSLPSTEPKLTALQATDWNFQIDDVIAVVSEEVREPAYVARQRTAVFTPLLIQELMALARLARAKGAMRFMSITPINVLMQPAALHGGLASLMESELHQLGFSSLFLVRPSDRELCKKRLGIAERLLGLLIDTASGLMAGHRHRSLSIEDMARAVTLALQEDEGGLKIIEIDHLHTLLHG